MIFFISSSLDLIKAVEAPATINSASLHPEKDFFVAGGEDFKLYKFDYSTKEELGEETEELFLYITFSIILETFSSC